jgi:antitoxin (DNA-binding transcriptional repressor) of toxin-antitoxin stability system
MSETAATLQEFTGHLAEILERLRHNEQGILIVDQGIPVARVLPVQTAHTTDQLLKDWPALRHLSTEEAAQFEADLVSPGGLASWL